LSAANSIVAASAPARSWLTTCLKNELVCVKHLQLQVQIRRALFEFETPNYRNKWKKKF
jgi:hypothetical protein